MPRGILVQCLEILLHVVGYGGGLARDGPQRRNVVAQRQDAVELAIHLGHDILARYDRDLAQVRRALGQARLQQLLGVDIDFNHGITSI